MTSEPDSADKLLGPLYNQVDLAGSVAGFEQSIRRLQPEKVWLFAASCCMAEVQNGGFLQLFFNPTGILLPEGIEGFRAIGMTETAGVFERAAKLLGSPYPRDTDARLDALAAESARSEQEMEEIFSRHTPPAGASAEDATKNLYQAFYEVSAPLKFTDLDSQVYGLMLTENGGFQEAAVAYADSIFTSEQSA